MFNINIFNIPSLDVLTFKPWHLILLHVLIYIFIFCSQFPFQPSRPQLVVSIPMSRAHLIARPHRRGVSYPVQLSSPNRAAAVARRVEPNYPAVPGASRRLPSVTRGQCLVSTGGCVPNYFQLLINLPFSPNDINCTINHYDHAIKGVYILKN